MRAQASRILVLCAIAWSAFVLWHYYATIVQALFGAGPLFDRPVLFDRWVRPLSYWGEAMTRAARAVVGALAVVAASAGTGRVLLWKTRREFDDAIERALFEIGAGFGTVSLLLLGLAAAHVYTPAVVSTVVAALAVVSVAAFARNLISSHPSYAFRGWDLSAWSYVFAACAAVALAFALVGALAPETEYDALWYHLWLPQQWLHAGGPVDIVQEYVSLYPLGWELLYGAATAIGGVVAAKLLHWFCLVLLAAAAAKLARLVFPRADRALVAALVVTAPTVLWEGTTAYVDLPPAFFITLSAIALWRYSRLRTRSWFVLAAVMMGFALAIKNLSLVAAAIAGAAVLAIEWRGARSAPRALIAGMVFAAIAILPPLPWYARADAASGNPVFPDLYRVFGARPVERWDDLSERSLAEFKARFGQDTSPRSLTAPRPQSLTAQRTQRSQSDSTLKTSSAHPATSALLNSASSALSTVTLPWNVTVHGSRFGASFGPLFLILVPFAFAARSHRAEAVAIAAAMAAFIAVWASPVSSLQGRFLIPLAPFAALLAAEGAAVVGRSAGRGHHIVASLVVALLIANLPPFVRWHEADRRGWAGWLTHVTRALPVAVVAGGESTRDYLERKVPSYAAWEFIDRAVPPDGTVLTFSGGDHLYSHRRRIWSDAAMARPVTWGSAAGEENQALAAARALGIGYVLMDKRQEAQTRELAIGSDAMRACCFERVYEDSRFIVFRIRAR